MARSGQGSLAGVQGSVLESGLETKEGEGGRAGGRGARISFSSSCSKPLPPPGARTAASGRTRFWRRLRYSGSLRDIQGVTDYPCMGSELRHLGWEPGLKELWVKGMPLLQYSSSSKPPFPKPRPLLPPQPTQSYLLGWAAVLVLRGPLLT